MAASILRQQTHHSHNRMIKNHLCRSIMLVTALSKDKVKRHYLVIGGLTRESNISVRTMAKFTPHPSESNAHA